MHTQSSTDLVDTDQMMVAHTVLPRPSGASYAPQFAAKWSVSASPRPSSTSDEGSGGFLTRSTRESASDTSIRSARPSQARRNTIGSLPCRTAFERSSLTTTSAFSVAMGRGAMNACVSCLAVDTLGGTPRYRNTASTSAPYPAASDLPLSNQQVRRLSCNCHQTRGRQDTTAPPI